MTPASTTTSTHVMRRCQNSSICSSTRMTKAVQQPITRCRRHACRDHISFVEEEGEECEDKDDEDEGLRLVAVVGLE